MKSHCEGRELLGIDKGMYEVPIQSSDLLYVAQKRPLGKICVHSVIIIPCEFTMLTMVAHQLKLFCRELDADIVAETCASALFKNFISENSITDYFKGFKVTD